MPLEITPVTTDPAELRTVAIVATTAMCQGERGPSEYIKSSWPGIGTPAGVDLAEKRFMKIQSDTIDPDGFLKAVDTETGEMQGIARWSVRSEHPQSLPTQLENDLPSESAAAYAQAIRAERNDLIIAAHRNLPAGPVAEIYSMLVLTDRQRSGVGTQLVKHIIEHCNARNTPIVLITNPYAEGFYTRLGFVLVEDRSLKLAPPFEDRPQARILSMIRPVGAL